ncbi:hypothetical protein [Homoserinimonas sp. A520]
MAPEIFYTRSSRDRWLRNHGKIWFVNDYQSTGAINERERPRILLWVQSDDDMSTFDWVKEKAATFRRVRSLGEVDLGEWDVIVTNEAHASIRTTDWGALVPASWTRVPDHLYIFRIFSNRSSSRGRSYFEFNIDESNDAVVARAIKFSSDIPGHRMLRVGDLSEPIQDLVKFHLLPAVEARKFQFGIEKTSGSLEPAIIKLRPFLLGPSGIIVGASYERQGGGSVWLLPADTPSLSSWFEVAMTEWHLKDRRIFPTINTWQSANQWDTREEVAARLELNSLDDQFAKLELEYQVARAETQRKLDEATARATAGPKSLLTSKDEPLQNAAFEALVQLGFDVEDMDESWPERERREDFRVRDPDAPEWLVLADATGVAKGAPGSKIATVAGYVTKYVLEERPQAAPGIWIIVNRLPHRDPMTRGDVYREDDLAVLRSQPGLAIDSAALYLLTQAIESPSQRAAACREWLRTRTGQVTTTEAMEWLEENA